jgi:hypothetical protein
MSERKIEGVLGKTEDGRFIVASVTEPYFCFEVASEEEADAIAARAVAFWNSTRTAARANVTKSPQKTITTLRPIRPIS